MTLLRGHFAMVVLVRTGADADVGRGGAAAADRRWLAGDQRPRAGRVRHRGARGPAYSLRVHGADRPGIVATITRVVARHGAQHRRPRHPAGRRPLRPDRRAAGRPTSTPPCAAGAGPGRVPRPSSASRSTSRPSTTTCCDRHRGRPGRCPHLPPGPCCPCCRGAGPRALRRPAPRSTRPTRDIVTLAADLLATQAVSPGCVGLAAQQVGVAARRVQRRRHRPPQDAHLPRARSSCATPRSSAPPASERGREGCMSVPGLHRRRQPGPTAGRPRAAAGHRGVGRDRPPTRSRPWRSSTRSTTPQGLLFLDRVAGPHGIHPRRTYR